MRDPLVMQWCNRSVVWISALVLSAAHLTANPEEARTGSLRENERVCSEVFPGGALLSRPLEPPHRFATTILYDGIETVWPASIWTVSGNPTWDDTGYMHYAGQWSAWCARGGPNGLDPAKYYYANNMNAWAVHGPFSLADATDGSWSFWHWTDTEVNNDLFEYMVSVDGTNFHGWARSGRIRAWEQKVVDFKSVYNLGNVCGQPKVWVAFVFKSNGSVAYDGTFVDEIRIEKTVGSAFDLVALDVFPGDGSGNELPAPYNILAGQQIYLCFRHRCDGVGRTPSFRREMRLDGKQIGFYDSPTTGGLTRVTSWAWTATSGTHSLEGRLDTSNTVPESNEANNIRSESPCFSVPAGGPEIRISPTTLTFNVSASQASVPANVPLGPDVSGSSAGQGVDLGSAEQLADGRVLVWVVPASRADLMALQAAIGAMGGEVLILAPEGSFLVALAPARTTTLATDSGVASLQPFVGQDLGGDPNTGGIPGMGERPPTPDEEEHIRKVSTEVDQVEPNTLSRQRALLQGRKTLPALVDNSISRYFPPIRSQGMQGSCAAWCSCYYYNTYTQARDENLTVSNGDNNHICSPAFMYPLINGGVDKGGSVPYVVARLSDVGCCSWALKPYSESDWVSWPSEAAWIDALKRRTSAAHSFNLMTDAGIAALKQHLANGNIAATRTDVYANWHPTFHNNEGRGIQNGVLFSHAGETNTGGHGMTFVGYDDNRSYNDGTTTRHGAFLLANSWGTGWGIYNSTGSGTKGFMWVSYDYVKAANSCFEGAWYNDDRDNYRPRLYGAAGINHATRGYVTYSGGVGSTLTPAWSSYKPIDHDGGTTVSIQDTKRVAVDLTEGISSITNYADISLFVKCSISSSAGTNGTITSAEFFHDFDGDGNFLSVTSSDPTVTVVPGQTGYARVNFSHTNPNVKSFTIYNDGVANLNVTDIAARDRDPWLSWAPDPNPGPTLIIPPGGSQVIAVTVDPSQAPFARNDDHLLVYSNDQDEALYPNAVLVYLNKPTPTTAIKSWRLYR